MIARPGGMWPPGRFYYSIRSNAWHDQRMPRELSVPARTGAVERFTPAEVERSTPIEFARSNKGSIEWERNKGDISKLIKYWTRGKGGLLIDWGAPCDFCSCVAHLSRYVPPQQVKGFCAKLHKRATGKWPGPRGKGKHCPC